MCISIHVPSWGTTMLLFGMLILLLFQSTFPRGERLHSRMYMSDGLIFQSTFPRGERRRQCCTRQPFINFNPRSLVGNDSPQLLQATIHSHFNPRSLVGNDGKFSQIFFVFLCNKYNFSTFYYPFSLFFSVIHVTFLIFVVRILPAFYVYF